METEPKITVHHAISAEGSDIIFTARFSVYAAKSLGLAIVDETAQAIAKEFLKNPELQKFIDRDKISAEITAAIGRAFVEKLMGKEDPSALQKKD